MAPRTNPRAILRYPIPNEEPGSNSMQTLLNTRRRALMALVALAAVSAGCGPSPIEEPTPGKVAEPTPALDFFRKGGLNPSYPTPTAQPIPGQKAQP